MSIADIETALSLNKTAMIQAHRRGDWERAKALSLEKERLKRIRPGACVVCGTVVRKTYQYCAMHSRLNRLYKNRLN